MPGSPALTRRRSIISAMPAATNASAISCA
jgi:hypothetical protein